MSEREVKLALPGRFELPTLTRDGEPLDVDPQPELTLRATYYDTVDLRLAKNIKLGGRSNVTLSAEMFNVFNSGTELKRIADASSSNWNRLDEILAPRIVRFGAKFQF